jgi:hypothetical protein
MGAPGCKRETRPAPPLASVSEVVSKAPLPDLGPVRSRASAEPSPIVGADGPEPLLGLGDTGRARDWEMTLLAVKPCEVETYFRPKTGNIKLGVEVEIAGTSDREVPVSAFYAKLVDADGGVHRPTLAGCTPSLSSERVSRGEQVRGFITFELAESVRGLRLSYQPFVVGGSDQIVTFSLGR